MIDPIVLSGADELRIVSGFASPAMASKHINDINDLGKGIITIKLIYGMSFLNGIELATHKGFIEAQVGRFKNCFSCFYSIDMVPVHAKVYTWLKSGIPLVSYLGSANYTQTGFSCYQQEAVAEVDPNEGRYFFDFVKKNCINCTEEYLIKEKITLFQSNKKRTGSGLEEITLSLLQKGGIVGERSGLNWGQREGRDPNQAYIPIENKNRETGFFPKRGEYFTVHTDDEFTFIAVIAQDNGKAIHSVESNAIIGKYFRRRLGLKDGQFVRVKDLETYGTSSVKFSKIDDETYIMDFSPPIDLEEREKETV